MAGAHRKRVGKAMDLLRSEPSPCVEREIHERGLRVAQSVEVSEGNPGLLVRDTARIAEEVVAHLSGLTDPRVGGHARYRDARCPTFEEN